MKFKILTLLFCLAVHFSNAQDWEKTFTHNSGIAKGFDVIETSDGDYVIAGELDLITGAIRHYIWLAKTDSDGNEIWSNIYDGGDVASQEGKAVIEDDNGNLYVAGSNWNKASVLKVNMDGDSLWIKEFGGQGTTSSFQDIIQDNNGNLIVVGEKENLMNPNMRDIWMMGMNTEGDSLWSAQYFESSSYGSSAMDISPLLSDQFLVTGNRNGQAFSMIINGSDGSQISSNTYQLGTGDNLLSSSIYNGGTDLLMGGTAAGFAGYSPSLFTTNSIGEFSNSVPFTSVAFGAISSIAPTNDAGFILTGSRFSFWNQTSETGFITKLNNELGIEWELTYEDSLDIQGASIRQTTDGSYIIAGSRQDGMWLKKIAANSTSNDELIHQDFIINLFPNPSTKNIQIEISESIKLENISINIYDNLGRLIESQIIRNHINSIDVENLSRGIYYYSIQDLESTLTSGKIILE